MKAAPVAVPIPEGEALAAVQQLRAGREVKLWIELRPGSAYRAVRVRAFWKNDAGEWWCSPEGSPAQYRVVVAP